MNMYICIYRERESLPLDYARVDAPLGTLVLCKPR